MKRRFVKELHPYVASVWVMAAAATILCVVASSAIVPIRMRTRFVPVTLPQEEIKESPVIKIIPVLSCEDQCIKRGYAPISIDRRVLDKKYCECDRTKIVFSNDSVQ